MLGEPGGIGPEIGPQACPSTGLRRGGRLPGRRHAAILGSDLGSRSYLGTELNLSGDTRRRGCSLDWPPWRRQPFSTPAPTAVTPPDAGSASVRAATPSGRWWRTCSP